MTKRKTPPESPAPATDASKKKPSTRKAPKPSVVIPAPPPPGAEAPATSIADVAAETKPQQQLTVIERASQVMRFDQVKAQLTKLAAESTRIVAIKDTVSYDECHSARMTLKNARIAVQATGKEAREDATAFSKAVIAKEKELIGLITPEEDRLSKIQQEWDDAREAEKKKKREAEEAIVRAELALLEAIRSVPLKSVGKDSTFIAERIQELEAFDFGKFNEAALPRATSIRDEALQATRELLANVQAAEEREKANAAERAELERLRALNAETEQRLAKEKAEAEDRAKIAADLERKKQEAAERVRADNERMQRERDENERQQVQNVRSIPLNLIGASVAAIDLAIADAELITFEMATDEALQFALKAKEDTIAKLRQMRESQVQADLDRKASEEKARADAEAAQAAQAAERQRLQDERMAGLRESAPPLPIAAMDALAALAAVKLGDADVAHRLLFAIERDRDIVKRLLAAYDGLVTSDYEATSGFAGLLEQVDFAREYLSTKQEPEHA